MGTIPGVGPAFIGYVDTTVDALRIVRAAVDSTIPRTVRRLTADERLQLIRSGVVFVFSVAESGIRRWTDGMLWSPSRIRGNFLIYKKLEGSPRSRNQETGLRSCELEGLVKKTFTVSLGHLDFHLVSYYNPDDVEAHRLETPRDRPDLMPLRLPCHDFQLEKLRNPPQIGRGPNGSVFVIDQEEDEQNIPVTLATRADVRHRHAVETEQIRDPSVLLPVAHRSLVGTGPITSITGSNGTTHPRIGWVSPSSSAVERHQGRSSSEPTTQYSIDVYDRRDFPGSIQWPQSNIRTDAECKHAGWKRARESNGTEISMSGHADPARAA